MIFEKELFKKPLSLVTLRQELNNRPETYREIADCCILLATGLDEDQRDEAMEKLKECVPEGEKVYVSTGRIENQRLRKRDFRDKKWRYGTRIGMDIIHYFSMN